MDKNKQNFSRREFLKRSATATAALAVGLRTRRGYAGGRKSPAVAGKKVIVLGLDGMDPELTESMMVLGELPNFSKLQQIGGYHRLGTSLPPQSPVAWANFITGAGPGTHGIFDFLLRHPEKQAESFFSIAETVAGEGYWQVGGHKLQLTFWPFSDTPKQTLLGRQGTPFWDYLDEIGVCSDIYLVPSNYPPSRSKYGHHRSISGLGTPDLLGQGGLFQYFSEDGPSQPKYEKGGLGARLEFRNHTARGQLLGPRNDFLMRPKPVTIDFDIHRDIDGRAALIDIQSHKVLLKEKQWSDWLALDFRMSLPRLIPDEHISGICRFFLREVYPTFQLYVTPINIDPSEPAARINEPEGFSKKIAPRMGRFYTTRFQEDYTARIFNVFTDEEYAHQAEMVLQQRLELLEYAMEHYREGVLFFYFSSTDLQSHIFWWDYLGKHPARSQSRTIEYRKHIRELYKRMDEVLGDILKRYSDEAVIFVLSDHGFAGVRRLFGLNSWLRDNGYIEPSYCTTSLKDVDWSKTRAYGFGLNSLYLNLKGREGNGIVEPGQQQEQLLVELIEKLEAIRDADGGAVIHKVYRADESYVGPATELAPDLVIGYHRGYKSASGSVEGLLTSPVLQDNKWAWGADHCFSPELVPGVLFSNRPIASKSPSLVDLAPTILAQFSLSCPDSMVGKNIFT